MPDDVPAVFVTSITRGKQEPDYLSAKIMPVAVSYLPPFWVKLENYFTTLENVKWSSQLGGTGLMRQRHGRIYRAIDKLMREGWHTPQIKIMTPFLEFSDMLGMPSWKHAMDVSLSGLDFTLMDDKDVTEELMHCHIPPMSISKSPKCGDPLPAKSSISIAFEDKITADSPVAQGLFQKAMLISTNGGPYKTFSRLHGTRDTLAAEVVALRSKIAALHADVNRLQVTHTALQSQAVGQALIQSLAASGAPGPAPTTPGGTPAPGEPRVQVPADEAGLLEKMASIESALAGIQLAVEKPKRRSSLMRAAQKLTRGGSRASTGGDGTVKVVSITP